MTPTRRAQIAADPAAQEVRADARNTGEQMAQRYAELHPDGDETGLVAFVEEQYRLLRTGRSSQSDVDEWVREELLSAAKERWRAARRQN